RDAHQGHGHARSPAHAGAGLPSAVARHRSFRQAGRRLPLRGGADATGALVRPSPATRRRLRRVNSPPTARETAAAVLPRSIARGLTVAGGVRGLIRRTTMHALLRW